MRSGEGAADHEALQSRPAGGIQPPDGILQCQCFPRARPEAIQRGEVGVRVRLRSSVVLDREREVEKFQEVARLVNEVEIGTASCGDDGHFVGCPEFRENVPDTRDFDWFAPQVLLVERIAVGPLVGDGMRDFPRLAKWEGAQWVMPFKRTLTEKF